MQPINQHTGILAPLDRVNVDTDAIIPKQFLRKVDRVGFGKHLFHEWRYTDYEGTKENPEFILNKNPYRKATVLLARDNFGCGSSREHAPWALEDFGFRVIVAPSFADIFANNCVKNGIICIALQSNEVDELFKLAQSDIGCEGTANLEKQTFEAKGGRTYSFQINSFAKTCLLRGLDQIGWTEQFKDKISSFESKLNHDKPWLSFEKHHA